MSAGRNGAGIGLEHAAHRAIEGTVRAGATLYDRDRDLPRLIRLDPFAPVGDSPEAVRAIVARLKNALRGERNRARAGHWTYDLNRHIALRQALAAESARLAGSAGGPPA
jgi:hypothetical protein